MNSESLSTRYWRSLIGASPVLDRPVSSWYIDPEKASAREVALWKFFGGSTEKISSDRRHPLSRFRSRSPSFPHTDLPLEKRTHFGAALSGVGYMLDFLGSKLAQEPPPEPDTVIAEAWVQMLQEIDELLSANREDREG
jgi:hypothetical protein